MWTSASASRDTAKTGRCYGTQDFGRPSSDAITFTLANHTDAAVRYTVDGKKHTIAPRYLMTFTESRPPRLAIQLPGATGRAETLQPETGAHYVITSAGGRYKVSED